jgi:ferredoxin-NADP reductase
MSSYVVTLTRRELVARETVSVAFAKPPGFRFKAGQAVDLALVDPPEMDEKGAGRAFSIVSAPHEDELVIATRARDSAFKRVLKGLPIGATLKLDGPFGSLTLQSNRSRTAVFLAGGIGITPFMSIIRQVRHEGIRQAIELVYSNRTPEHAAFLAELRQRAQAGGLRLTTVITEAPPGPGEKGRIDAALLREVIARASQPLFYVAGPPGLVNGMRELLASLDVQDDDVRTEDFSGY